MIAILCDQEGKTLLGSDGYLRIDGRFGLARQIEEAREYRESYRKNFPHTYAAWTHVMIVRSGLDRSPPHRL